MMLCNKYPKMTLPRNQNCRNNNWRNESLEAAETFDKKKYKNAKKISDYWKRTEELMQGNETKSEIEFVQVLVQNLLR